MSKQRIDNNFTAVIHFFPQFGTFRYQGAEFVLEPTESHGPDAIHLIRRHQKKEQEYLDEGKIHFSCIKGT